MYRIFQHMHTVGGVSRSADHNVCVKLKSLIVLCMWMSRELYSAVNTTRKWIINDTSELDLSLHTYLELQPPHPRLKICFKMIFHCHIFSGRE